MSAFGGKAEMTGCGCLLSRSLLGVKRTWLIAAHMSASDPKRTWRLFKCLNWRDTISSILRLGASNEATRLHRVSRRLDRHMAVCCMGAAGSAHAAHRRAHDFACGRCRKRWACGGVSAKHCEMTLV